tara:strand:- start:196 stop:1299 length:1104 start_codon:yes stop_codon:yes gene_type:complete
MILNINKFILNLTLLLILSSCSFSSKDSGVKTLEFRYSKDNRDLETIAEYQSFYFDDLDTIQKKISSGELNQQNLKSLKLLKKNYSKILAKKEYIIMLNPSQKYSQNLIELIYEINLPIKIKWSSKKTKFLPDNLLSDHIDGFCSTLYEDSISSIKKNIDNKNNSTLVIYSSEYLSYLESLKSYNNEIISIEQNSTDFQKLTAEILGINTSEFRFNKISNLNPNQNLKFSPRPRSDIKNIVLLIKSKDYKSMMPALRYHGSNNFQYFNFISSLEEINSPLQLLDYEDSFVLLSSFLSKKIGNNKFISLENFLERGILKDWLLIQILEQSGVLSAIVNGETGTIFFTPDSCVKREVPLQKVNSDLFSN